MNQRALAGVVRLKEIVGAALGKRPLTLFVKNCTLMNVFTGELIERSNIGFYKDTTVFAGTGSDFSSRRSSRTIDAKGAIAIPGLIDTHLHIESSMMIPSRFAEAVLPRGTTAVFADPHEIANVLGKEGVRAMLENAKDLPMKIYFFASSCVPESRAVTSGAEITPEDIESMLGWEGICGLGEVMDYDSVLNRDRKMLKILEIARARKAVIDGHCVLLSGARMQTYASTGPEADHENFDPKTDIDKLRAGLFLKLRGPDVLDTRGIVSSLNMLPKPWNVIAVTDDVMADNLEAKGHLDWVVRSLISEGMDPVEAIRSATLRPAQHMRMQSRLGAIAPGRAGDVVLLQGNLKSFRIGTVISNGAIVASDGRLVAKTRERRFDSRALHTMHVRQFSKSDFEIRAPIQNGKVKINFLDFQGPSEDERSFGRTGRSNSAATFLEMILSKFGTAEVNVKNGAIDYERERIAPALVFERHGKNGRRGAGFVRNLIRSGALATTVAHDSHNLVVLGTNAEDMIKAATLVIRSEGGIAAVRNSDVLSMIELPIAGLLSTQPLAVMAKKMRQLRQAFKRMGVIDHPYMPLPCLLTLSVIPHGRITDRGMFDVDRQKFVPLFRSS
jgi:adenine deaminase